tara:strand:- start:8001 stop:8612 length:612 start_codon:yes stop_codon:yes gene_type:complete
MELSSILDALNNDTGATEKVAHVTESHSNRLDRALEEALSMDKTASVNTQAEPSEDLIKIAQRLADAEQLALVKEAEMYGAAVCDGFLARMTEHDANGVKVASFGGGANVDEVLLKQAMELGYRETTSQLQNLAQQAYDEGYSSVNEKTASHDQVEDQAVMEKIAAEALQAGYQEAQQMIKVAAEDRAEQGYAHAMNILANLG